MQLRQPYQVETTLLFFTVLHVHTLKLKAFENIIILTIIGRQQEKTSLLE